MVALATVIGKVLPSAFDLINTSLLYLLPVLISSVRWGLWPSLTACFMGVLAFDYFFVPPVLSFTTADIRHLLSFAIFLIVAMVTATLAARLRAQVGAARERERRVTAVYELSRNMPAEKDMRQVLKFVVDMIERSITVKVAILMPGSPYNLLTPVAYSGEGEFVLEQKQRASAQWAFDHGKQADHATNSSHNVNHIFVPIADGVTSLAVLAVRLDPGQVLSREQRKDIRAFVSLTALAITRVRLREEAEQAKWLFESEKLHAALLNAVSHDLRTPLSAITGAVTGLLSHGAQYSDETRKSLLLSINEGAQRMNRFVTNLLDMARIESGILKPNREWCDMLDIVGVAAKEVRDILPDHRVEITASPDLPLVEIDFGLMEHALINLLENAAKYAPEASTVSVRIYADEKELRVAVQDAGPSIADDDRERIFDKFYRLRSSMHVSGTGLGLSISRAMIEAHGGSLWVEPGPKGGNAFTFSLPIGTQPESVPAQPEENHGQ
jgi:two-component system, OmpR family, sensor histidine kinase KdpD